MNILIAGGSGVIGTEITYFLSKKNKVYSTYRKKKPRSIKNVIWTKMNLEYPINLRAKIDIIINCAVVSEFSKKNSINNYVDTNIVAVKNLLDFAIKNKSKKIINLSSISVYKLGKKKIIKENSEINNKNILSITKFFGEQILDNNIIDCINLRLPAILNLDFKKNHSWMNNLISNIKDNKKIKIFNANSKFNSVIHIRNIFELIEKVINKEKLNGTFNFVPSSGTKLIDIVEYIKDFYKSNSRIELVKSSFVPPHFSSKKIYSKLNFKTPSTLSIIKYSLTN